MWGLDDFMGRVREIGIAARFIGKSHHESVAELFAQSFLASIRSAGELQQAGDLFLQRRELIEGALDLIRRDIGFEA